MRWDARPKFLLVMAVSLTYGLSLPLWQEGYMVGGLSLLFFLAGKRKMGGMALGVFWLTSLFLHQNMLPSWLDRLVHIVDASWPSLLAGHFLLVTTSSYEVIHGLRRWRLPEAFLISLGVMVRFLPAIKEDAAAILSALRVRGLFLRKRDMLCHPLRYVMYFLLPLLFSLLRTVQELTVASLTKGLAQSVRPSAYLPSRWTYLDWSLFLWSLSILLFRIHSFF